MDRKRTQIPVPLLLPQMIPEVRRKIEEEEQMRRNNIACTARSTQREIVAASAFAWESHQEQLTMACDTSPISI